MNFWISKQNCFHSYINSPNRRLVLWFHRLHHYLYSLVRLFSRQIRKIKAFSNKKICYSIKYSFKKKRGGWWGNNNAKENCLIFIFYLLVRGANKYFLISILKDAFTCMMSKYNLQIKRIIIVFNWKPHSNFFRRLYLIGMSVYFSFQNFKLLLVLYLKKCRFN